MELMASMAEQIGRFACKPCELCERGEAVRAERTKWATKANEVEQSGTSEHASESGASKVHRSSEAERSEARNEYNQKNGYKYSHFKL